MADGPIAGLSVVVAQGRRIVHAKGYGYTDLENELLASPETVYPVGSITKQFTAAAVMQLVEEGRLRLGDPITRYLPDYPNGQLVTIESLLNHTAGIKNYTTMSRWWETSTVEMAPTRMISVFRDEPLDFVPGTNFSYSNSGYFLLGLIVEQVSGKPFGGYLSERLFGPLELGSTHYCDDRLLIPNRARGYRVVDGAFIHADFVSMSQAFSAGAVCSSVLDLLRWNYALSSGLVISEASYRHMVRPGVLTDGTRIEYGLGFALGYVEQHHRISHTGGTLGFAGHFGHYDDDGVTIIVLSNTEAAKVANIENEIGRLMLGVNDQTVQDILLDAEALEPYLGRYDLHLGEVDVRPANGRLEVHVNVPGAEGQYLLLHQGNHTFQAQSDPQVSLTFTMREGTATGFELSRTGISARATRVDGAES